MRPAPNLAQKALSFIHRSPTPYLCTTVIDERDLVNAAKIRVKDIQSDSITKHKDAGTFTYHAKHCKSIGKDVIVHGVKSCRYRANLLLRMTGNNGVQSDCRLIILDYCSTDY